MAQIDSVAVLAYFTAADEAVNRLIGWAVVHGARDPKYHELVDTISRTMGDLGSTLGYLAWGADHDEK